MMIRLATQRDLRVIDALRRKEQEAVGFIPMSRYEQDVENHRDTLLLIEENGDSVGFIFWSRGWPIAHIQQLVIRHDARRWERGTALVKTVEMAAMARTGITCRCRLDLEAVEFWKALGYREIQLEEAGRRKIPLIRFYKELTPALFDLAPYLSTTDEILGPRKGFRIIGR